MSPGCFRLFLHLSLFLLAALAPIAHQMSFSYPGSMFSCEQEGICKQGNTSVRDDTIILTVDQIGKAPNGSVGWVYYTKPLLLWDNSTRELTNFTTKFDFVMRNLVQLERMGDGLAFFLSASPYTVPTTSGGENLGLMSSKKNGNTTGLVAVEFDTYANEGLDPDSIHIGIDINSIRSKVNTSIFPRDYVGEIKGSIAVSYDSNSQNLSVLFSNQSGVVSLSHIVDLSDVLPNEVIVGLSAATGNNYGYHSVVSWVFNSTLDDILRERNRTRTAQMETGSQGPSTGAANSGSNTKVGLLIGIGIGVVLLILIAGLVLFGILQRKKNKGRARGNEIRLGRGSIRQHLNFQDPIVGDLDNDRGPRPIPYKELAAATDDFTDDRKLGGGGFGTVYQGYLSDLNLHVAIKRLSKDSKQGIKEYASEVRIISKLRHKNLVKLVGWCHEESELLLVYEFMAKGSLEDHLFTNDRLLPWTVRYNISLGLASALLYLHTEWDQCVVHRDIKCSNVMLDDDYNVKLGDFGLARLIDHGSGMKTTFVAGTLGYLAPECLTGRSTQESDVYSFGIVLLEIACGRPSIEPAATKQDRVYLLNWMWSLYGSDDVLQAADQKLKGIFHKEEMERVMVVGLWCTNPDPCARPSMKQVIAALSFELIAMPVLPKKVPMPVYSSKLAAMETEISTTSASSNSGIMRDTASGTDFSGTVSTKSTTSSTDLLR